MRRSKFWRGMEWSAGLVVALSTSFAVAQDAPFQGVVVADKASVLAGGTNKEYVVGYAVKGTLVHVKEVIEGYNAIDPLPGTYSYIPKAVVDAKGDKTGVVNADHAWVVSAALTGPADSYKRQVELAKGATVKIVAEEGNFDKIVPPAGAVVFLAPGTVQRVESAVPKPTPAAASPTPAEPAQPRSVPAAKPAPKPMPAVTSPLVMATTAPSGTEAPAAGTSETPHTHTTAKPATKPRAHAVAAPAVPADATATAAPPTLSAEPSAPPVASAAKAISPQVQALEARLAAAQDMPLEKQPLDQLAKDYDAAAMDPTLPAQDHRIVVTRSGQIKRSIELANALKALQQASADAGGSTPMAVPAVVATPGVLRPAHYDVVGQLLASGVYDGDSGPRLFRLVEPATMRTIAYVQPGKYDAAKFLGRIVGINGKANYDPALKLNVFDVTRLEVLEAAATTEPAK